MLSLNNIILIDHHAHSLRRDYRSLDAIAFRQCFSETRSMSMLQDHVPQSLSYCDMLDKLSRFLDLSGEHAILEMRERLGDREYINMLYDDASIGAFIIDDGFQSESMLSAHAFAQLCERPTFRCVRIESVLEECLRSCSDFEDMLSQFDKTLSDGSTAQVVVAFKTIAAYRGGLQLELSDEKAARNDFIKVKEEISKNPRYRIVRGQLYHFALGRAFEIAGDREIPIQVHSGIGDQDEDLFDANPLHFRNVLENPRFSSCIFIFLHCYPFVRETAYLCSIYKNVYMDISLVPFVASPAVPECLVQALSVAPFSKILLATDGHSVPETHWYAAHSLRIGATKALSQLADYASAARVKQVAERLFHLNARELYNLEGLS